MALEEYSTDFTRSLIHRKIEIPVPWSAFVQCLESRLGRYNDDALKAAKTLKQLEAAVNAMRGDEPFSIYAIHDHGELSSLAGRSQNARQYTMGNSRVATKMTVHDIRAAQHAPVVSLIHEAKPGFTTIEFDLAESVFGGLTDGNEECLQVARLIDEMRILVFKKVYEDVLAASWN
ncbi:TT1751-like protein [Penicillium taxi]|uniref:TT1751-like protein n=1 Tax=Penicillium taxi TaxID=168475 RepID=UPI002544F561|nr:TT1751-like protein [Penicillium taxi]KAJ5901738.1 TT1751-like protein [Penicillium taxi]